MSLPMTLAERERHAYITCDTVNDDLSRMQDKFDEMTALVEQAADYLKAGDVDRAACTLSEALK